MELRDLANYEVQDMTISQMVDLVTEVKMTQLELDAPYRELLYKKYNQEVLDNTPVRVSILKEVA